MNKRISVYDSTVSARTYLGYIVEQAGGFAHIGRDGKLYIKTIGEHIQEIPLKYFQNFKWGEKFKVSRIKYEDGIQVFEKGDNTGNTIYINQDNMFIVDQEQIDNIYELYENLEIYSFSGDTIIDPALDVGDLLLIDGKYAIYQGFNTYTGKWKSSISSDIQSRIQEETTVREMSEKAKIRRIQSNINQIEGKITQIVQETSDQGEEITQIIQDVDSIKQQVEKIQDVTAVKEQTNNLYLEDIAERERIHFKF